MTRFLFGLVVTAMLGSSVLAADDRSTAGSAEAIAARAWRGGGGAARDAVAPNVRRGGPNVPNVGRAGAVRRTGPGAPIVRPRLANRVAQTPNWGLAGPALRR